MNDRVNGYTRSKPRVNPVMTSLGDAVSLPADGHKTYVIKKGDKNPGEVKDIGDI